MAINSSKCEFPEREDIVLLDKLSDDVNKLQYIKPDPDDFFDRVIIINESSVPLEEKLKKVYSSLSGAVNTLHTSRLCMEYCKKIHSIS